MGFVEAIRACLSRYARFAGRARRGEFWWFYLFTILVSLLTGMVDGTIGSGLLGIVASLALLPPTLAAGARRLHDIGRSGWWQGAMLPPLLLGGMAASSEAARWLALPLLGLAIGLALLLLWWLTRPGEPGANRYGPPAF